jgi:hypothetical protein
MSRLLRFTPVLGLVPALFGAGLPAQAQKVGVNSAVNPDASGTPPGATTHQLVIGQQVVHDELIKTGADGQTQILFLDESAMTVGPSSDVTIDNFIYDPNTGKGQLAISATAGVLRFVGGKLSKNEDAVTLRTPSATIGVRGGIFIASVTPNGPTQVTFLYGQGLTVTAANQTQTIIRPGFSVTVAGRGAPPSSPAPAPPNSVSATLGQFNGKNGASGGSSNPPTDASIANSNIPAVVSGNVLASVQQATQNNPATATTIISSTGMTTTPAIVAATQSNNGTISSQSSSVVVDAQQNPTPPGTPISPTPTPTPTPAGGQISGILKIAPKGSTLGFVDQSASTRIPYIGTIAYPVSGSLTNGVATGSNAAGDVFTLSPLTAGATTNVLGTASTGGSASGPATETADGNFFFANLISSANENAFVFGGIPVQQSFYAATPTQQFSAFSVQPDATLGNGSSAQTIPFLPAVAGGTMPNAVVSPIYLVTQPNTPFGSFNPNTNPNVNGPHFLQASVAINGQGTGQSSALSVMTGSFFTSSDTGLVAASGPVRATYIPSGGMSLTHVNSGFATVPDAKGNNLFGGTTIDGFVLDSNDYNTNLNFVTANANAFTVGGGGTNTAYAFNQPVLAQTLPTGVGSTRSALTEQGFFGGTMTNGSGLKYALQGSVGLATNPANSTLYAEFAGIDPFTSSSSGIGALILPFGTISGRNYSRSTFIDNNIFAATENATQGVAISDTNGKVTTYPTVTSGATTFPTLAMVSSATVPNAANGLLPAGASFCACQYLQWGYWQANIPPANNGGPTNTVQSSFINTWVAGTPTVNMPTSGSASYNGAAIGSVNNNGASYMAAGSFNNTYNFGSNTGTVAINNFDGHNFSGTVSGASGLYAGAISGGGSNRTGTVLGQFYGPAAAETGGTFAVQATSGPSYIASGIFAGKR